MNEYAEYIRWVAQTWHFHQLVYFDPDLPPTSKERRRLRSSKQALTDSFGAYLNVNYKLAAAVGTSWRRIIDENNINYGQWTLTTQKFSVERTTSASGSFFGMMTFLLLEATLAAVV